MWHCELNIKWNNLITGFPGLLNTPGTLPDRSQPIKQNFKKCQKMEGPMTPGNLGPKTIKLLKSLKIMKISVFFNMEKMRITILRREHWTTGPDHWYGIFWSKLCFWKLVKKCQKYQNWINFGSKPCAWPLGYGRWLGGSKQVIGCLQTPGASRRRALQVFLRQKRC